MEAPRFYGENTERKEPQTKTVAVTFLETGDRILCKGIADEIVQRIDRSDEVQFILKSGESVMYDKTDEAEVPN